MKNEPSDHADAQGDVDGAMGEALTEPARGEETLWADEQEEAQGQDAPTRPSSSPHLVSVDPAHYALEGEIARGGMGVIQRARDRRAGREVALKQLLVDSPHVRRRFEREARVTAQLQHPSIVPVYEVGCWPDGRPFYSMKLVEGRPLNSVVQEARDADARLALIPRILPAVEAIAYAHDKGVLHRDLKPGNVLIGEFGETLVIDWGLAKGVDEPDDRSAAGALEASDPAHSASSPSIEAARSGGDLTVAGAVLGTPAYMPPEQAGGGAVDARADVYSLGALLYYTLSGAAPYEGATVQQLVAAVLAGPPQPLSKRAPAAPADLVGIVDKAMARRPSDRYANAGELARDLQAFTTGRLVGAYHYTSWELVRRFVRRNRALSLAVVTLVCVALVGGAAILRANQLSEQERARAVAAEALAARQERRAHERLAQVHWQSAVRHLQGGDHLGAEALAAAALLEEPANPLSPYHRLPGGDTLTDTLRAELLAGPAATWAAARALRFAARERELIGHEDWIYDVLPSRDGRWVVTTSADRRVHIWSARDGSIHRTLEGHTGAVFQAALRADGAELATSGYDGTVRLWSFPEGELIRTLEHPDDRVYGVCYAADGTLLAAGHSGSIAFFDPVSGALVSTLEVTTSIPWKISCPTSEPVALLGTSGSEAVLVDLRARSVIHRFRHEGVLVRGVALTPDGRSVFTADRQGTLRRFDRTTGELAAQVHLGDDCRAVVSSPDGRWLALASEQITVLESASLRRVARLQGHSAPVLTVAFDATSHVLYSGGMDHRVVEWVIPETPQSLSFLSTSASDLDALQVSADGRHLASAGDDSVLRVWDLRSGQLVLAREGHTAAIRGVHFIGNTRVATSAMDRTLRIYPLDSSQSESVTELPHFGDELTLRPRTSTLAIGSGDGSVVFHDADTGAEHVMAGVHEDRTWWVEFDPSGETLASASFSGAVALIDPDEHTVLRRWAAHDSRVYDADWRPDGSELTTADLTGWVRGWNPATGARIRQWRVLGGEQVVSLAWSPDGRLLLVTTSVGARVYHPDGVIEARIDLGARTSGATWTDDGRMIFASRGRVFVLPLDTESWRRDPAGLLSAAERDAGATLDELIRREGEASPTSL